MKRADGLRPSLEKFTDEHFEAVLELPLNDQERRFVSLLRVRGNTPIWPELWWEHGFGLNGNMAGINKACKDAGLHIRLLATGVQLLPRSWWGNEYRFYVMEEAEVPRPKPRLVYRNGSF